MSLLYHNIRKQHNGYIHVHIYINQYNACGKRTITSGYVSAGELCFLSLTLEVLGLLGVPCFEPVNEFLGLPW